MRTPSDRRTVSAALLCLGLVVPLTVATRFAPADAAGEAPGNSSVPMQSWTLDGVGRSILEVGNTIYVGGSFTQAISPDGNQRVDRRNLAAFDATTGAARPAFHSVTTTTTTTTVAPTTTTSPPPSGVAVSVAPDAEWAYLDDGSDQGNAWNAIVFDDATWAQGISEFGYGDGDERTVVGFGPSSTRTHPATCFRHRFTSAGTPNDLTLTLPIDDSAIVRINGVEAYWFNTPSAAINFQTRAVVAISGGNERLDRTITLGPLLVVPGANVITVEVHRDSFGSSDITFLASLTGRF